MKARRGAREHAKFAVLRYDDIFTGGSKAAAAITGFTFDLEVRDAARW